MKKFVEVRKLIADKNPVLLKWLPGFIIKWVERIIHQDKVNDFMWEHRDSDEFKFCGKTSSPSNSKLPAVTLWSLSISIITGVTELTVSEVSPRTFASMAHF